MNEINLYPKFLIYIFSLCHRSIYEFEMILWYDIIFYLIIYILIILPVKQTLC